MHYWSVPCVTPLVTGKKKKLDTVTDLGPVQKLMCKK